MNNVIVTMTCVIDEEEALLMTHKTLYIKSPDLKSTQKYVVRQDLLPVVLICPQQCAKARIFSSYGMRGSVAVSVLARLFLCMRGFQMSAAGNGRSGQCQVPLGWHSQARPGASA